MENSRDQSCVWWHVPAIPALGKQRQEDHCNLKAAMGYIVSSWPVRDPQKDCLRKPSQILE